MRDLTDISISAAVVHLVEPKRERLVLSAAELPNEEAVFTFLARHVTAGLGDSQAMAVSFIAQGEGRAWNLSDAILADPTTLLTNSQGLARRLYEATKGDKRISDGALASMLCTGKPEGGDELQFLSLLKLDPATAFRPIEERTPEGDVVIRLEPEDDVLPSTRERLQKAAFVRADTPGLEYRVLALDRQTAAEPAQFFIDDFLGAEFVLDRVERTRRLYSSLVDARNQVEPDLSASELAAMERVIDGAMSSAAVNLDDLITNLPVSDEIREKVDEVVSRSLPDREFELDPDRSARLISRKRFRADNNLEISVPTEFFDEMVNVTDIEGTDPPERLIEIRTRTWQER